MANWFKRHRAGKVEMVNPKELTISPEFRDYSADNTTENSKNGTLNTPAVNLKIGANPWMDREIEVESSKPLPKMDGKIPGFLKVETVFYGLKLAVLIIGLLASIAATIFVACAYCHPIHGVHIVGADFAPGAIGILIFLVATVVVGIKAHFWKKDMQELTTHFDTVLASNGVRTVYGKLVGSFANINWLATFIYLALGTTVLCTFIAFYGMSVSHLLGEANGVVADASWHGIHLHFGALTYGPPANPNYHTPGIVIYIVVTLALLTLLNQVFWQIFNLVRLRQMDHFYQQPVISPEGKAQIRAHVNKRDLILFLLGTVILAFAAFITWRIFVKRK